MQKKVDGTHLVGKRFDFIHLGYGLIEAVSSVDVGGSEGSKFLMSVLLRELSTHNFFVKEFSYNHDQKEINYQFYDTVLSKVKSIVSAYMVLQSKGYLVPEVVGYFEDTELHKVYLVTSDMTEGGKYRLWGKSDNMTVTQNKEFKDMRISRTEYAEIERLVAETVAKANKDNFFLDLYYLHLRQDKQTRKFEICFLDVDKYFIGIERKDRNNSSKIAEHNQIQGKEFLDEIFERMNRKSFNFVSF